MSRHARHPASPASSRRFWLAALAGVVGAAVAIPSASAHIVVLLDRALQAQTVDILKIAQGHVVFTAPGGGEEKTVLLSTIAAIAEPGWWSGEYAPAAADLTADEFSVIGQVELVDGRVIQGRPDVPRDPAHSDAAPPEPPKDLLRWEHPVLRGLEFKLEDVRRVRMPGALPAAASAPSTTPTPPAAHPGAPESADRDTVLLINGDRLTGFVERIGSEVWLSDAGVMTKVPAARVSEVRLVNPPVRPEGTLAWLQGGSVIRVEHVGADPKIGLLLGIEPASGKSRQVSIGAEQVRALLPAAERFIALSSLKINKQEPTSGRAFAQPARILGASDALLGVRDIELPGPMTVDWQLVEGAGRVGGWLILPAAFQEWGDCIVRIDAVGPGAKTTSLVQQHINGATPSVPVNAALPPGATTLRLTIDAGEYGPIQDRIVLHRFVVVK